MSGSKFDIGLLVGFVLVVSLLLTRGVMALAHRRKWEAKPSADRWSKTPTALYGGVAIVASFAVGTIVATARFGLAQQSDILGLCVGAALLFAIGIKDDIRALNPLVKLVGQIVAIMPFLVGAGLAFTSTTFVYSIPLVLFWMLALTNSFNLLDNMDGLSAGTAAIVGIAIACYSFLNHNLPPGLLALMISASCIGFLFYNFRVREPAKIFMGDCGSMFLGFTLSGLAVIAFCPVAPMSLDMQAAQCALPLLIMAVPIFDTTLVVIIRKLEGRAISQGGRDHSSHRLVYTGMTDKRAVLVLYLISAIACCAAVLLHGAHSSALVFSSVIVEVLVLTALGVHLHKFKVPHLAIVRPRELTKESENGHKTLVNSGSSRDDSR